MKNGNRIEVDLVLLGTVILVALRLDEVIQWPWLAVLSPLIGANVIQLALIILMAVIGTIHFIRKNYLDKIRVRMFYGFFIWMDLAALAFLLLQPQHFNAMLLIMILNTSPLIAHFIALTSTKITNIVFLVLCFATLLLTVYNIWNSSFLYS